MKFDPNKVYQTRFYDDNPHVVKECQGWTKWETITDEVHFNSLLDYIGTGYKYQVRTLEQTDLVGLRLIKIFPIPNDWDYNQWTAPDTDEIVPSLDSIQTYLYNCDIITHRLGELGFKLVRSPLMPKEITQVVVNGKSVASIPTTYKELVEKLKLYSRDWKFKPEQHDGY